MTFLHHAKSIALVTSLVFSASIAVGENHSGDGICNLNSDDWEIGIGPDLDGFWQVTSVAGTLEFGGRVMTLPPGQPSVAGISLKEDGLWISSDQMGGEHRLNWVAPDISWDFTAVEGASPDATKFLDDEDIAILVGCKDADTLPRLEAHGTFQDPEGSVDFQLYLYFLGPDSLYGVTIGYLNGGEGTARRLLNFSR